MLLRLELVTKYESSKVGAIPLVVVLSWEEYTGIVPTSFNRSVSKDRKRSVFRLGQGRGPTVQPGIFLFSFVLPFPFIWKEEEIDPQQLVIIPGPFHKQSTILIGHQLSLDLRAFISIALFL